MLIVKQNHKTIHTHCTLKHSTLYIHFQFGSPQSWWRRQVALGGRTVHASRFLQAVLRYTQNTITLLVGCCVPQHGGIRSLLAVIYLPFSRKITDSDNSTQETSPPRECTVNGQKSCHLSWLQVANSYIHTFVMDKYSSLLLDCEPKDSSNLESNVANSRLYE